MSSIRWSYSGIITQHASFSVMLNHDAVFLVMFPHDLSCSSMRSHRPSFKVTPGRSRRPDNIIRPSISVMLNHYPSFSFLVIIHNCQPCSSIINILHSCMFIIKCSN
eukprot:6181904-Karenia_brevis.AAC.1